jgi:hypothetical protein
MCRMGDMVGEKWTHESTEDVFRHGRSSRDVACCRVMEVRKTPSQSKDAETDWASRKGAVSALRVGER